MYHFLAYELLSPVEEDVVEACLFQIRQRHYSRFLARSAALRRHHHCHCFEEDLGWLCRVLYTETCAGEQLEVVELPFLCHCRSWHAAAMESLRHSGEGGKLRENHRSCLGDLSLSSLKRQSPSVVNVVCGRINLGRHVWQVWGFDRTCPVCS